MSSKLIVSLLSLQWHGVKCHTLNFVCLIELSCLEFLFRHSLTTFTHVAIKRHCARDHFIYRRSICDLYMPTLYLRLWKTAGETFLMFNFDHSSCFVPNFAQNAIIIILFINHADSPTADTHTSSDTSGACTHGKQNNFICKYDGEKRNETVQKEEEEKTKQS